jgi:hypothetical protein
MYRPVEKETGKKTDCGEMKHNLSKDKALHWEHNPLF